ncbi:murein L,D-transpeptidase catalytic domain family protein [Daejeonella oryzae]|uniref:murein L,D-transpeptidase catalytic domain family protein n=1 Tax=Daejeonella oryzae TaxID=1122943 RepID=UPI000426F7A4|nr:murein L,D-transpeptidase catalytic domain family protein [Daejeonella oryzae]
MKKPSIGILSTLFILLAFTAVSWTSNKTVSEPVEVLTKTSKVNNVVSAADLFDQHVTDVYNKIGLQASQLDFAVFKKALVGYYNFKDASLISKNHNVITIVDFNKPSTKKRLWIVDLDNSKLLFNTLVAHGQGSGDNMAMNFSNTENSHQSSLGFYITSDIYFGKHGLSMKLDGMDKGFNSNARERAIVVHGAEYVSQSFVNSRGRLGRSHGCPALPVELTKTIIDNIKGKTTLFINGNQKNYISKFADMNLAVNTFMNTTGAVTASL